MLSYYRFLMKLLVPTSGLKKLTGGSNKSNLRCHGRHQIAACSLSSKAAERGSPGGISGQQVLNRGSDCRFPRKESRGKLGMRDISRRRRPHGARTITLSMAQGERKEPGRLHHYTMLLVLLLGTYCTACNLE